MSFLRFISFPRKKRSPVQQVLEAAKEARRQSLISINVVGKEVHVVSIQAEDESHDVLLVVYDAGGQVIKTGKGPNKKTKVAHRNVVNDIMKIGEWKGGETAMMLPDISQGMEGIVLVQGIGGGVIATVMKL